ncbi:MAG TPA: MFS transporter, partial [Geminicoccaceae bacterium]|nr:MFS transporter [Geminicoccaceae bacterium]
GRTPPELRRARLATATLFFANGCGLGSWLPHIPDVKIWHGLSDGVLGLALLAIAGGAVASLPVAGALTARYGSRPTSRAAALLFCAVLPLPLLAPSFPLLLAAFVLLGIGIGALDVSMNAHAVLVEERYGRAIMSSFHGLFSLGGLVGAVLAGGAMQVGLPPTPHLLIAAAVLGASVLAAWPVLLPTAPAPAGGLLFVVPRGRLAVLGAVALIAFMAEGAMGDWSAIYIRMDLGASPATAAWGFAAFSLTMAIGRFSGDRLVARFSPVAILVAGAVIGATTLGAALLASHPAAAVIGFAGMGFGLANVAPIVFSAAGRLPELAPGIGIAAVSTAGYGGFLAGPPLIGLIAEASGLPVGLGLVALAVGFMVLGTGALRRRPAAALALAG